MMQPKTVGVMFMVGPITIQNQTLEIGGTVGRWRFKWAVVYKINYRGERHDVSNSRKLDGGKWPTQSPTENVKLID